MYTIFKMQCEYDFGGNIDGYVGVYSSKEAAIETLNSALGPEGMDFDTLNSQGLTEISEINIWCGANGNVQAAVIRLIGQ